MTEEPLDIACKLVGRFQFHFSQIEAAINLGIAKVLDLNDDARDIVCANLDFVKKLNIIKAAVTRQFVDKDGSLGSLLDRAAGINNPDRQTVIHSTFEPHGDGVRFIRVITREGKFSRQTHDWDQGRFTNVFRRMETIASELERLVAELKPYKPSLDFSDPRNSMYIGLCKNSITPKIVPTNSCLLLLRSHHCDIGYQDQFPFAPQHARCLIWRPLKAEAPLA